jgi:hypothetical protein
MAGRPHEPCRPVESRGPLLGHREALAPPCRAPAVKGWSVCRFHGVGGGGPTGSANGNYRHGAYTAEVLAARRAVQALLRRCRSALKGD